MIYTLESKKGVIFSGSTPCSLILLYANLKGLFCEKTIIKTDLTINKY